MTKTMQDQPTLYSAILNPDEVAELLQVPVRTLEQWRYRNVGPPYRKVGRHIRYLQSKVMEWFENDE